MEDSSRTGRYIGRAALRRVTTLTRCHDCGRQSMMPGGNVGVRWTEDGAAGFAGLVTCGRVWLCPVCNAKVMAQRANEIGAALLWASLQGFQVIWGAITCRHNAQTPLDELLEIQVGAWRSVVQSRFWSKTTAVDTVPHVHIDGCDWDCDRKKDSVLTDRRGRVGYIRAAEITVGGNGWHPHFHPVIIYQGTREQAQAYADEVVTRWIRGVEKMGGEAVRVGGQQLRVLDGVSSFDELAQYVTKATYTTPEAVKKIALESVWSQGKWGRRAAKTESHWGLLHGVELGSREDARHWVELEAATDGHRMITWSRGLRRFAGLMDEKDDEEIAAEEVGTVEDTVAVITATGWESVRDRPEVLGLLLDQLGSNGPAGFTALLDAFEVEWTTIDGLADVAPADAEGRVADVHRTGWGARPKRAKPAVWVDVEILSDQFDDEREKARRRRVRFDRSGSTLDDDVYLGVLPAQRKRFGAISTAELSTSLDDRPLVN